MDKKKNLWEEVKRNLASSVFNGGDNSVMQILELSYKHLPQLQDNGNIEIADVVVDFENGRETYVLDYLVGQGKSLQVIGKTTLAKKLFNHPSVNTWFEKQSWCVVSQTYQCQSILADLLTQINGAFDNDSTSKMNSESLVVQIHRTLWGRRYLIVMDDVWDSYLWDDLMSCFPDNGNGSRIMFTTRNEDTGPSNCKDYAVPSLSNEECWELLEKKVFGNKTCPVKLIGIGKKIAANCWGLPLAVVVIAGVLSTMDKKKNLWEEVRRNLASLVFNGGDNSVMKILELSCKHLPERLKPCFLYFRAFTLHKKIRVGKLLRLWISEGFIHKEEGKSVEDVAKEYLMELIDKDLVMVAKRGSDGGVKACVLHELLRDLCSKICEDEKFIKIEGRSNIHSVYENGLLYRPISGHCITWSYCQQIRSLYEVSQTSAFFPGRMRLLRVLHFVDTSDRLTGVEYLVNLRNLVINELRISSSGDNDRGMITKLEDEKILKRSPNLRKLSCQYMCELPSSYLDLCFHSHLDSLKIELNVFGVTEISFPSNIKKLSLSGCWLNMPWEKMSIIGILEKLEGNEAGSLICSLYSTTHRSFGETDVGLTRVLHHISLLKANIQRFLDLLPCISKPAYTIAETSMVDSLILRSVIHDLEDLIIQEDNRIADVKDQIKVLQQGLAFLQSSVKDVGRPSGIEELKELLKRSGNMAHQTEYLILSFLSGDAPLWYLINRLTDINKKIEVAGTELQEITKKHKLGGLKAAKHFNTQDKGNIEIADVVVDFEDGRETYVLDYLVGRGQSLRVISITGMPGLGKTCLAKKLFDKQSWCVVSQKYESQSILADILAQINGEFGKDSTSKMDSESLVVLIHKTLWGRRYLIVMDDVWDSNLWDDLMRCFPDDGNGSRILFTTRDIHVGPSNFDYYALPSLSNEECWELLEKKVFGNNICPAQLIGIGKKIASNCWGLPLAVVVIAGILSTMDKEIHIWKEVRGNLASHVFDGTGGDNSVTQMLELSYKHLPERLKPCFLYLRKFTFQKKIRVRELLKLWISEGFIHKEEGKSVEDVAEEYLMELIDKNLVMVAKRGSYGGVKTCVLHDLLCDLCDKLCEDENFLKFEKSVYSVYENGLLSRNSFSNCATWSYCQQTRTWSYCQQTRTWSYCQQTLTLHEVLQESSLFPGRTRFLRVFRFNLFGKHLSGVEYLVNLRYLVIGYIPVSLSIGNLVNLEYLRVVERMRDNCLPSAILSMMKLRDLSAPAGTRYDSDCSTSRTNNLEFLSGVRIRNVKDEEMLKCSPNLRKL